MNIFCAIFLTKYPKRNNNKFGFLMDQIQIIVDVGFQTICTQ
jgi:hypothetical protein